MREREAELTAIANLLFKPAMKEKWEFFDANHTAERSLRLDKNGYPMNDNWNDLHNPWKLSVPTATANSHMVGRYQEANGSIRIRRFHGMEIQARCCQIQNSPQLESSVSQILVIGTSHEAPGHRLHCPRELGGWLPGSVETALRMAGWDLCFFADDDPYTLLFR